MFTQMQITILPGAAGRKNPCYFIRVAAVAALLLHSGTAASRVELFKADLILPIASVLLSLLTSLMCTQPPVLNSRSAYTIKWVPMSASE